MKTAAIAGLMVSSALIALVPAASAQALAPCDPAGAQTLTGSVTIHGDDFNASLVRVGAFSPASGMPTCGQVTTPDGAGDYLTGKGYAMGGFADGPFYRFVAWVDDNGNGRPDPDEPEQNVTGDFATSVVQDFVLEAGDLPSPGDAPPACEPGASSISGDIIVIGGPYDPAQVRVGAFVATGDTLESVTCVGGVVVPTGDFETGALWTLGDLNDLDSFFILGWVDQNGNDMPDDGDMAEAGPMSAAGNPADVPLDLVLGGEGGGPGDGAPGPIMGPGDLRMDLTLYYNDTGSSYHVGADAPIMGGFSPQTPPEEGGDGGFFGQFNTTANVTADGLAMSVIGFTNGSWGGKVWVENDSFGGPGAYEPLGFLRFAGEDLAGGAFDVSGDLSGYVIELRDPPADGWPLDLIDTGDHGGDGCDATNEAYHYVNGSVTDGSGNPVGGGKFPPGVEFINQTSTRRTFVQLDGNGTYSCRLPAGEYTAEVHSEQGFAFAPSFTLSDDLPLDFTVSFDARPPYERPSTFYGGTVWGNITLSGAPAGEGIRVRLFPAFDPNSPGGCQPRDATMNTLNTCGNEAETNATGNFVFTYMGPGVYDIEIEGDGVPRKFFPALATVPDGVDNTTATHVSLETIDIVSSTISGRVERNDTHAGVAGAFVNAFPRCMPGEPCMGGGFAETDETGNYTLLVEPGTYGMFVSAPSGESLASVQLECHDGPDNECVVVEAGQTVTQDFSLVAGTTITGRVTDGAGEGVRAFINAISCPEPTPGPAPPQPCAFAWGQTDFSFEQGASSGFYNLTVEPGTYEIRVEPDRFERPDLSVSTTRDHVLTEGVTYTHSVVLGAGNRVRGNITADGAPVRFTNLFAQVHVEDDLAFFGPPAAWAYSDGDGTFDMTGLPDGVYDIIVEPPLGSTYMRTEIGPIEVSGGSTQWTDISLSGGGTLEGYILAADGSPVENAFVDAFYQCDFEPTSGPMAPPPCDFPSAGGFGRAETDANGHYAIGGLTTGSFGMFVSPPLGTSYTSAHLDAWNDDLPDVAVGDTTFANFTLDAGATMRVCVADESQEGVDNAWVSVFSPTSGFGGGEPTRSDGCASIRGVRPGTYDVEVQPPFGSAYARKIVRSQTIAEGEEKTIEVTLGSGVFVSGTVTADGSPVENAFVNVFQITDGGPGVFGFAQTDGTGAFNVTGLVPGRYGMHVQPPHDDPTLSAKFIPELSVPEGGRTAYAVTLGGGGSIRGQVLAGGVGVADAWIGAWSFEGGSGGGARTDADGNFVISGLSAAEDYNLDVFPPFDRQDLAGTHLFPLTVVEGSALWQNLSLTAGGTLTGRVVNADGEGVQYAFVNVNGNGTFGWGSTDSDGNFSIRGLSASEGDELRVFVQPGPGQSFVAETATHTWAPDADSVSDAGTLSVGAGVTLTGRITRGGEGVSDVDVHAWPGLPYQGPPLGGSTTTGPGGWYNITGLPEDFANGWDISVQPRDGSSGKFTPYAVWTNETTNWFNVSLGGSGGISLLVQDAAGSAPIDGARVDCVNEALRAGRGNVTGADGIANASGLPAGTYACRVFAEGYASALRNVTVTEDATTSDTVSLGAVATFTLRGSFTNGTGDVGGRFVVVVPNGTIEDEDKTGFNTTSSEGAFVVPDMPPGNYDIRILDGSGEAVAARLNVAIVDADVDVGDIEVGTYGS